MKKIKLLMPILGLSSIATMVIPLTSCSQSQQYTVKFDTQGGSTVSEVKVDKDGLVSKPTDPTKDGCEFCGWYTDKDCTAGKEFDFNTKITQDITLYAKWFDGKVTDAEFKASVAKLYDVYDTRNFTIQEKIYYDGADSRINTYYANKNTAYKNLNNKSFGAEIEKYGCRWEATKSSDAWSIDYPIESTYSIVHGAHTVDWLNWLINDEHKTIDDFEFNASTKTYKYDSDSSSTNVSPFEIYVRYNKNRNIEYIEYRKKDSNASIQKVEATISNYGSTTLPTEFEQIQPNNLLEAYETTSNGTATTLRTAEHDVSLRGYFYVCDLNKFASSIAVDNLSATTHNGNSFAEDYVYVYKSDGSQLEAGEGKDYKFDGGNQIDLINTNGNIKMTDTLVFEIYYVDEIEESKKIDYFTLQ